MLRNWSCVEFKFPLICVYKNGVNISTYIFDLTEQIIYIQNKQHLYIP